MATRGELLGRFGIPVSVLADGEGLISTKTPHLPREMTVLGHLPREMTKNGHFPREMRRLGRDESFAVGQDRDRDAEAAQQLPPGRHPAPRRVGRSR